MRITNQMQLDTVINAFQLSQQALEVAERKVTTGHNISQPSDDPFAASQAILFRQRIGVNGQLQRNLDMAKGWLDATDSSLNSMDVILQRARQLSLQLANDTYTDTDRQNAAKEVHQLLLQAVDVANSRFGGQYVFGGTKTTVQPFIHDGSEQSPNLSGGSRPPVVYNGDTGRITRQTDQAAQLQVNVSGDHLKNVFDDLAQLEYDLNNSSVRSSGAISALHPASSITSGAFDSVMTFSINSVKIGLPVTVPLTSTSSLAGKTITGFAPNTPVTKVVDQINAQSNQTGVVASIDRNGVLVLQNGTPGAKPIVVNMVDKVTTTAGGLDVTGGTGVPVPTGGRSPEDVGLTDAIDNSIGSVDVVALDSDLDKMQSLRAQIGAKTNRVDEGQARLTSLGLTLVGLDSKIEDIDMAKAISDLASRQTALQAALGVAAKTLPPTLLDFLR
jgi:flagellar hook-associated protein 3